ncbi:transmembrane sensor [Catalinimonas alkaloidigena]|uniref:FecR family protein n=1 Tax=Catalinimonas alkaloidigena TaxID=1075417 RepID=UPI002405F016|nr:FecR domain-containing protein [Catalinimonas alkaloidigena]MDF9799348.1 transmembrane sensor [Catalinimonas alkaloidigena]
MNNYQHYEAKDFVMDELFQSWVHKKDPAVIQFWEEWRLTHPEKQEEIEKAVEILRMLSSEKNIAGHQEQAEVWEKIQHSVSQAESMENKQLTFRWYYAAASIALIILAALGYWTLGQQEDKVYFSTGFGETRTLMLPDSTLVTLNANSRLSYLSGWQEAGGDRNVWMEGEGFFEVSHRNGQKFIVHTSQAAVEVLGTSFNVSERRGSTEVILSSGKVALHVQEEKVLMEPGEQVSYDTNSKQIEKKIVNPELLTSWRNNELIFEAAPLSEIAILLEDNYGYQVIFEEETIEALLFSGTISAQKIKLLLEALSETHQIQITQQDDTLIFKK